MPEKSGRELLDLVLPEGEDLETPESVQSLVADLADPVAVQLEGLELGLADESAVADGDDFVVTQIDRLEVGQKSGIECVDIKISLIPRPVGKSMLI